MQAPLRPHTWLASVAMVLLAAATSPAQAHAMATAFAAPAASASAQLEATLDERVNHLAAELRCLVCQNQTIAESTAPLALQLKAEVRAQLARGDSEQQVRDFMAQRYGDFVLYRPPVTRLTWLLWGGPLALLLLGGLLLVQRRAQPRAETDGPLEPDALEDGW